MKLRPNFVVFIAVAIGALLLVNPNARATADQWLASALREFSKLARIHLH